jgi:hypothetical protein
MRIYTWTAWGTNNDGEKCNIPVVLEYNEAQRGTELVKRFKEGITRMIEEEWDSITECEHCIPENLAKLEDIARKLESHPVTARFA